MPVFADFAGLAETATEPQGVAQQADQDSMASRPRFSKEPPAALSTGQAARFCLVTADTVATWIKKGELPAQRTLGGRYRIFLADLRAFMQSHEMSTAALDAESGAAVYCCQSGPRGRAADAETCRDCPVFKARAMRCAALQSAGADGRQAKPDCQSCPCFCHGHAQPGPARSSKRPARAKRKPLPRTGRPVATTSTTQRKRG
jgi:excisionase family DNA binding protein